MNNENENDKRENKKKKGSLLVALLGAILATILFHVEFGIGRTGLLELMSPDGNAIWGYGVLLLALFLIFFTILFLITKGVIGVKKVDLPEEERARKKRARVEFLFLIIDVVMTAGFVRLNWAQISSQGTLLAIAEVAAFFAIVWAVFEFFNHFKLFPQRILNFFVNFFMYICIPTLVLIIVLLGAYQAKYQYVDTFSPAVNNSAVTLGDTMQVAYKNIVFTLYNIGQSNPNLWSWLPIAAFFIFTILLLIDTFTHKDDIPDEKKTAQEIIDEALKQEVEELSYERGEKKRPLLYNFFHKINEAMKGKKQREREAKEKEDDKHITGAIYSIKFTEMKGGKNG